MEAHLLDEEELVHREVRGEHPLVAGAVLQLGQPSPGIGRQPQRLGRRRGVLRLAVSGLGVLGAHGSSPMTIDSGPGGWRSSWPPRPAAHPAAGEPLVHGHLRRADADPAAGARHGALEVCPVDRGVEGVVPESHRHPADLVRPAKRPPARSTLSRSPTPPPGATSAFKRSLTSPPSACSDEARRSMSSDRSSSTWLRLSPGRLPAPPAGTLSKVGHSSARRSQWRLSTTRTGSPPGWTWAPPTCRGEGLLRRPLRLGHPRGPARGRWLLRGHARGQAGGRVGPQMNPQAPPSWMTYVNVDDADAVAAKVAPAGGQGPGRNRST